ncbi:MAG: protein translocase subunit SecD [Burkholderiales bacterium]|jgi:preprotein translocase subunit SecD|nr:protein translocase subunit SecD [Burkholderiales bacterium]
MNRYPPWKYILIVIAVLFGALYSVPNLFPEVPAVQVSSIKATVKVDNALLTRVQNILKDADVAHGDGVVDPVGVKLKMPDTDTQMHARDVLQEALGDDFIVALNMLSSTPAWMEAINIKPMNLGLDLRGGVHFLLQVDMRGALDKAADRYSTDLRTLLRDRKIQNRGIVREGHTVVIRFRDAESREAARNQINRSNPELQLVARGDGDDLQLVASLNAAEQKRIQDSAVTQNMATLRNRVNELGVAEPIVQQAGADRIVVQLPGVQDTARAKSIIGRTATLEIRMVDETPGALEAALRGQVPYGSDLFIERNGGPVLIKRQVVLTGDRINDAQAGFTENNQPSVNVSLDTVGARIFKDVTRENVGKRMAILLVERNQAEVITAPVIREEIGGGRVQISGSMTSREANDIALLMRAGALAAPMEIVEERTVGPSLGQENIDKGFNSVLGGFIALILFICVYYRVMGMVSAVCLSVNLVLLVALLSALQATLTLPGIAAMALTLGISIDANVLINERIREELRWGAPPHTAIIAGYERAWNTILDSNITNLIAGLSLFLFGSGPVKGFAVVHCLGIATSLFSAVFVSRGIVTLIYGRRKKLESISIGQVWKPSTEELGISFVAPDGVRSLKADKKGFGNLTT